MTYIRIGKSSLIFRLGGIYLATPFHSQAFRPNLLARKIVVLDKKQGDVNGDGRLDQVFLVGNRPEGPVSDFADQITLVIQDGYSNRYTTVSLPNNAGYRARLFLGDFDKDQVPDILVSIDAGGSGGYGYFYMYSFKHNRLRTMFDVDLYNNEYKFNVYYEDFYKVSVSSPQLDVLFTIDISSKGPEYLSQYYNDNGRLKQPVKGEVLALGALSPIVSNEARTSYDLLAMQRIIGPINADTLGYVENLLVWSGTSFVSARLSVSILSTKLAALF
ncbi:FG-GAP-like repeat-containing protein [Paenibacillus solisilvae]|uniref:FG-GAP-like repeat-containing protein n=1 Tax=Paenibacillus solisilvae TaxID=2486751 RepID=A0ABW0W760_9BACL